MNTFGYIVIIKRTGSEGHRYPLSQRECLFGRGTECDIRLQLPVVSKQQCKIEFNEQLEAILINLNSANPTQLNGATFYHPVKLEHGDLITIFDRSFRFEYENGSQNEGKSRRSSEPGIKAVIPTQSQSASILDSEQCERRDQSFRDTPIKYSEENITRQFSPVHSLKEKTNANEFKKDDDASDNVEEHLTGKVPTLKTKELKENTTNVIENTVSTASGGSGGSDGNGGDVSLFSTLEQPGKSAKGYFSPFSKLFGLMKEELSCKNQQIGDLNHSNRKSGAASQVSMDGREWEAELLHLPGSRSLRRSKTLKHITISGEEKEGGTFKELWLEDPFKNCSSEKVVAKAQDQELQQLSTPRKRRKSEELLAENSGERKNKSGKEARRRSAPVGPLSEAKSQHSLYPLRSQTKTPEMCSLRSDQLSKLGREALEAQESKAMPAEKPILKESDSNGTGESVDLTKNKGSSKGNKNQLTPKKASNSGQISKKIQDELDFEDVSESDGLSAKRRRVSFGVHLRPELFDENLPPNTPVKKGESPGIRRTSFGNCPPRAVLKKPIIKQEHSKLPEKEPPSTSLVEGMLHVQDRSLELPASPKKISSASSDDISQSYLLDENAVCVPVEVQPQKTMNTPSYSRRSSGRRSQYDTLRRIYAKRRSGASEANLMVVHSWADVVRLGTRKPQTGVVVKHGLERRVIKKQKRLTPKKPANQAQNHFSTGHANSPCTIVIGRAHTEKVTAPIRPCRMLNNFVLNPNMDMNGDLTGLADMFETPMKQKPQSPETGTTLQHLSEEQSSSGDASSGPTSGDFERMMIPFIPGAARQISSQSITCRRSPRNRQSWRGDDEISIKALREISEIRSDKIMKIPLPDIDVDHKILTPSSKKAEDFYTKGKMYPTPYLNRVETPDQIESATHDSQQINLGRSMNQSVALGGEQHSEMATPNSGACVLEDICIKGATEIPSNKGEQPKENFVDIHIDLRDQKPKMSESSLGVTTSLKTGSDKEQPVTDHLAGIQKHIRISLQNEKYSPTGANKMIKLKPDIVSVDVLTTPGTVTIKNELGGKKKIIKTPEEKIEPVDDLIGIREIMITPTPMVAEVKDGENKVADSAGDDVSIQKNLRTAPKQVVCSAEDAEVHKKRIRTVKQQTEVQDLTNTEQLMSTPKRKCESVEHLTVVKRLMRTPKDKVELGEDVAGNERLMRTPKEKELVESHKSNKNVNGRQTPKQKSQSIEDMVGISRLTHVPKEKREPPEDLTDPKELMSTPKQVIEPVKDKKVNKAIMKKSSPKYESGDLTDIKRLMRTPKVKGGEPVEDLTGIKRLMKTPKEKGGEPVEDLTGIKRLMKTPKEKEGEPVENLTGIKRLMRTPKVKGGEPAEDLTGIKRLMRTPKVKGGEPEEDLTGIKRLMRTPKVKGGEPVEDLTGIKRLMRTPKVKGEPVEDFTGIKRLMRSPKEKGEVLEDLTDVTMFMETPDKVAENISSRNTVMQSNSQEIPDRDSEFSEKIQKIVTLRRPAIKDFSGSNLEAEPKSKESSLEVDYTELKEMFESPEESKDQTMDQCQKKICSNPCEDDENQSNISQIDELCSVNLEDNIMDQGILSLFTQRNKISQAMQEHDDLTSKTENTLTEKKSKKSLLSFQNKRKDKSDNQRTISLRSSSKTKSDSESLGSTKIHLKNDEKIVKKTSWEKSVKEMVEDHARVTSQSVGIFCKTDKGLQEANSLSHSEKEEKEEHVESGPRMFGDTDGNTENTMVPLRPRRRNQADKEGKTNSSDVLDIENSEQKSVKNLRESLYNAEMMRTLRSRNKNREPPSESDVSHTDDKKKLSKRLPRKVNEKITPLRFSRRNKTNKKLQGSSPLLSEVDILAREKNENKGKALRSRNKIKTDTKLQESSSLVSDIVSSPTEGYEKKSVKVSKEKTLKKRIVNKGMMALRSRNKNKEMFLSESDKSCTDDEKESVKSLPKKLKEQKILLDSRNRNNTIEELNSLLGETDESYTENEGKYVKSYQRKTVSVNEDGRALRTRNINKTSTDAVCIENKEKKPMASLRSSTRSKGAKESKEPNVSPAKVLNKLQISNDEKKPVKAFQKLKDAGPNKEMATSRSRSKNKVDKESQESNILSGETDSLYKSFPGKFMSLRSRSQNKIDPETQEVACISVENSENKPLESLQEQKLKENTENKTSLRSGSRNRGVRLLHSSSVAPEELYLKDEKNLPVKVQKNLNDAGNGEKMSLRSRSKNKMDTGLKVPTSRTYAEKDAEKSMSTFPGIFKNPVILEGILPLTRNRRNKVDKLQEIYRVFSATDIIEADEKKLSSLENKAENKVEESFRTGSRNEVGGELCDFPLLSVTKIAYSEKNQEETEKNKILKEKVMTEDLASLVRSRLRNQNDSELIVSNPLPKIVDISPLVEDGKENIVQNFPDKCLNKTGGIISQASPARTRLGNKSKLDLQRSTNLRKDDPSTVASKTTVVTAGKPTAKKAKNWKQVNRGKLRTANIKLSEPTDVENYTVPDNPLLKSAPGQDDTFKVSFVSSKETQSEPLLKEGSTLLNNTSQTGEKDALSGNEIWPKRLSNNKEQPGSQERGTLRSRRKYTLRETKPSTRSSKQNDSKQTARKNIKA
uniref:Chmadrin (Short type) n=1 Tax=Potorous tridactylus TaxID=9310 RepID=Q9XS53_POTTR|nr:chmadrin (short type) [Potorous tridactylus]